MMVCLQVQLNKRKSSIFQKGLQLCNQQGDEIGGHISVN